MHPQSSYPEVVPSSGPIYSPATGPFPHEAKDTNPTQAPLPHQPAKHTNYARWLLLVVVGIIIAVIAGLAGGFIGKSIEAGIHEEPVGAATPTQPTDSCGAGPTSTRATVLTKTATETLVVQPSATGTVDVPSTGCSGAGNITGQTSFNVNFTTICQTDWPGSDIFAFKSGSVYDCADSCYMWNEYGLRRPRCLASAFVPDWSDSSLAIEELGAPMNCFLKQASNPVTAGVREKVVLVLD
ncbi:hypothetical protein P171DRAFT_509710 [Karstenula rhodostoma CBS 690.94]|uniref:Apple domain-containing protein n=1 Tax=Karstenula rhodostoma CBS 690.94 TaxID=1392251 RepID=A0A9P4PNQ3_9PLEO|nr:hypothetical protein P171DRAFT_509710 [Karstenula rhodostoma CBS 690.94]